jgi:hypothetical protein
MRKINVLEFVSPDGVVQAPGGPEEDTNSGFAYGGWTSRHGGRARRVKICCGGQYLSATMRRS